MSKTNGSSTKIEASPVETVLNDQLADFLGPIGDLAVLWRVHEAVVKRIRAVEKATRGKPKKERDPDAPKKTAGPQLLAWNAQVARIAALSAQGSKGALTYNHAKALAGIMKAAGLLIVKKESSVVPTDAEILKALEEYYTTHNPAPAIDKAKAKKEKEEKEKSSGKHASKKIKETKAEESDADSDSDSDSEPEEKPKSVAKPADKSAAKSVAKSASKVADKPADKTASKTESKSSAKSESKEKKKKEKSKPQEETYMDMEPYDYIIDGKSYERIDANGHAFIWDAKGKYMGVYNEKKKTFDTSIQDPTM
jgi:outer membrane biosynthesis protein TonB